MRCLLAGNPSIGYDVAPEPDQFAASMQKNVADEHVGTIGDGDAGTGPASPGT